MTATLEPVSQDEIRPSFVKERFHLDLETAEGLYHRPVPWGFGLLSEVTYYRTYSRMKDDGTQECWADTVIRVVNGVFSIRKDWYKKMGLGWDENRWQNLAGRLVEAIFTMKMLPPGRGLWAMGTDYIFERGSMALNNCGYVNVEQDLSDPACWAMDALMCGVGIGFSTENATLPKAYKPNGWAYQPFTIPDSREGWVESVRVLIDSYFNGGQLPPTVSFNYDQIRPEGTPLKGFGGLASGPKPLIDLHERLRIFLNDYADGKTDQTRLIADVFNAIGACVVAGNIRRSAQISMGSVGDKTFLNLKNYEMHPERADIGWMSNNSVILRDSDEFEELPKIAERVRDNGEPGIINLINIQKYARIGKKKPDKAIGMNPCFTGDTRVWTLFGPMRFDELVGQETPVLTQNDEGKLVFRKMYDIRLTRRQEPIYRVSTLTGKNGFARNRKSGEFRATGDHVVFLSDGTEKMVKDLQPGDSLSSVYRRKANTKGYQKLYNTAGDYDLEHRIVAAWETDERPTYPEFHVDHKNEDKQDNHPDNLRIMPHSEHNSMHILGDKNPVRRFPERNLGAFKDGHEPTVGFTGRNHSEVTKEKMRIAHNHSVVGIEPCGYADVYDGTVEDTHKFFVLTEDNGAVLVHNCAEIALESYELCNLVECFPTRCDSIEELWQTMELATFYASTVSLLPTHDPRSNAVITRNRRIGVSASGISDWIDSTNLSRVTMALREGYEQHVEPINTFLASEAGVPASVRLTTVKPSGTISLLAGVSPGMHWPVSRYAIRRMRISEFSPMVPLLQEAGVPCEKDVYSDMTLVFSFPQMAGGGKTRSVSEVSIWEQASLVTMLNREWADNSVSNTLTFRQAEANQIERVLAAFAPVIKSISMLPDQSESSKPYPQLPYEPINEDEYFAMVAQMGVIDWSRLNGVDGEDPQFCNNEACLLELPEQETTSNTSP